LSVTQLPEKRGVKNITPFASFVFLYFELLYGWGLWRGRENEALLCEELKRENGGSGRPPKLNKDQTKKLKERFKEKGQWTTKEVKEKNMERIWYRFIVESQVWRILKNKLKMH